MARLLRRPAATLLRHERLRTPDDDFIDLDWWDDPSPDSPVVLVLHGLEGCSKRNYVRNVCAELLGRGVTAVAMNFRGCSGEINRAPRFYHSGETSDVRWVLRQIRGRYPGRRFGAMGFSLGGNVLLKLLGEDFGGRTEGLEAAATMSVPYDLQAGCGLLEESVMGRLYSRYFLRSLRRKVEAKRRMLGARLDLDAVAAARTIREFDDRVTAPLHGFRDAEEYYEACSSSRFLSTIDVPTLLIHAVDDPFLPPDSIPRESARANPALDLRLEHEGGHVGFLEGSPGAPRFWADEAAADFLSDALGARPARR